MEGGFAIALVALATWAALLPGAVWQAIFHRACERLRLLAVKVPTTD